MQYLGYYDSPLGRITMASDGEAVCGVWFDGQKYYPDLTGYTEADCPALLACRRWLGLYFAGREPDFLPPLQPHGSEFRQAVWAELLKIPYGETTTYGAIAQTLAWQRGLASMSAQAVGGAVGHNPISILIPCHRVVGAGGSLTGYAGGVARKLALLELEKADLSGCVVPTKGTAL